jgi:electron transfer flavoprotein alpha/beta subunit
VLTITNAEHNVPRIPKTRDVMMSYRKPLTSWSLADLGLDNHEIKAASSYYEVVDLFVPTKDIECEFVEGDDLDQRVGAFAEKIAAVAGAVG